MLNSFGLKLKKTLFVSQSSCTSLHCWNNCFFLPLHRLLMPTPLFHPCSFQWFFVSLNILFSPLLNQLIDKLDLFCRKVKTKCIFFSLMIFLLLHQTQFWWVNLHVNYMELRGLINSCSPWVTCHWDQHHISVKRINRIYSSRRIRISW